MTESLAPPGNLRRHAARGTIINATFQIGFAGLGLIQRVIVARLLLPSQLGLWSVVLIAVLTILFLKNAGIGDKFVQQRESDQERAFQKAFTIDLIAAAGCVLLAGIAIPLLSVAYGRPGIIVPGLVLTLAIVGNSLQSPVWIHYREMNYARQRTLLAIDPTVTFIVTVILAVAGAGVWSLIVGAVAGAWTGGLVAIALSPYKIGISLERSSLRDYFQFSWPVVALGGTGIFITQCAVLVTTQVVGLRGAGGIGVSESLAAFTDGVDSIVSQALYPAICRIRDRADLLLESFVKSNRLALLWGMPFGLGIAVFAPDLVRFVIGEKWHFAINVIRAFGVVAAFDQLGFNWLSYLRALDWTRPMAVLGFVNVVVFFAVTLPLILTLGMSGFALGWLALGISTMCSRIYYLRRLFPGFKMLRHASRAMLPCIPGVAVVLAMKAVFHGSYVIALVELGVYISTTVATSIVCERTLLVEVLGYLRGGAGLTAGLAGGGPVDDRPTEEAGHSPLSL